MNSLEQAEGRVGPAGRLGVPWAHPGSRRGSGRSRSRGDPALGRGGRTGGLDAAGNSGGTGSGSSQGAAGPGRTRVPARVACADAGGRRVSCPNLPPQVYIVELLFPAGLCSLINRQLNFVRCRMPAHAVLFW